MIPKLITLECLVLRDSIKSSRLYTIKILESIKHRTIHSWLTLLISNLEEIRKGTETTLHSPQQNIKVYNNILAKLIWYLNLMRLLWTLLNDVRWWELSTEHWACCLRESSLSGSHTHKLFNPTISHRLRPGEHQVWGCSASVTLHFTAATNAPGSSSVCRNKTANCWQL